MTRWLIVVVASLLGGCGYNQLQSLDEQVKASWSEVINQYQRRADLIPNLVNTVKGYAQQEKTVLTQVTEARAKASSIQLNANDLSDPAKVQAFQNAQNQLGGSLGRLLATFEAYPDLKSNQNFLALQSQLEGTENRIAIARRDYNEAVRSYNIEFKTFPNSFWAMFHRDSKPMQMFQASSTAQSAPSVSFASSGPAVAPGSAPPAQPAPVQ